MVDANRASLYMYYFTLYKANVGALLDKFLEIRKKISKPGREGWWFRRGLASLFKEAFKVLDRHVALCKEVSANKALGVDKDVFVPLSRPYAKLKQGFSAYRKKRSTLSNVSLLVVMVAEALRATSLSFLHSANKEEVPSFCVGMKELDEEILRKIGKLKRLS